MNSVDERTAEFFDPRPRRRREIVTPEGVALHVEVAGYGERAAAVLLDVIFVFAAILVVILLFALGMRATGRRPIASLLLAVVSLIVFVVRYLYFIYFELAWQGRTPGKRAVGLRVIDRRGGHLSASAVIARNLTRELETFMPLQAMLTFGPAGPGGLGRLAAAGWLLVLALLPLFSRDRLRGGDVLAGTMVIIEPRRRLLPDLVTGAEEHGFTEAQLRSYGAFELQVLEEVLREPESNSTTELRRTVCDRICRKIGWRPPVSPRETTAFLQRFYAAERAFLERERLYGRLPEPASSGADTPGRDD